MPKKTLCIRRFEATFEKNGTPLTIGGGLVNDTYLAEMANQTKLMDGASEVLDYLHGRYKIALITNGFTEVQYDKLQKSELSKYFSKVFTSEEIGTPKPGRKIFEYAVKSMNARKKSSLMIGDSWEADIIGAMNFGIDQIYYNPDKVQFAVEGMFFPASLQNFNSILTNTPSITTPNPQQNHNKKVNTAFISRLDQLLIIL
jgi:putative hydrolase of the HAD superfamily